MKLVWDSTTQRLYETGISEAALYVLGADGEYGTGVAWNGLVSISESPSGAEVTKNYANNKNYISLVSAEELALTIEAFTYPEEFAECDGSAELGVGVTIGQQTRKKFALAYKTKVGNDVDGTDHGYKIHIVYGCVASPSEKAYTTINDSPEAITFSWEVNTTPVDVEGYKPTALVTIDSTKVDAAKLATIEKTLYGDTTEQPTVMFPADIITLLGTVAPSEDSPE